MPLVGARRALLNVASITYLLRDLFTTDRAAGAVNGTPAEPGPGTRTVTDTGSKETIAGGMISIASTTGAADPSTSELQTTRAFGRALLWTSRRAVGANDNSPVIGFATGANTDSVQAGLSYDSSGVAFGNNIAAPAGLGTFTAGTFNDSAVVLRATGHYLFERIGGVYQLLWASGTGSTATLFAVHYSRNTAGRCGYDLKNFRVPDALYNVPVLAYDTLTRADGSLGVSEVLGPDGQAVTARAWTVQAGTISIVSNAASLVATAGGLAIATVDVGSADVVMDLAITRTAGSGGGVLRYVDANNYLRFSTDGTNCLLEQVVAGTPSTLRTGAVTYGAGNVARVILQGTTGLLFYNGAAVGASFTVPSSSATLHGLYGTDTSVLWDNCTIWPRGTGGEYAGLDAY